jgi:hypothetical protein
MDSTFVELASNGILARRSAFSQNPVQYISLIGTAVCFGTGTRHLAFD